MKRRDIVIFDHFIPTQATVYTSDRWSSDLGLYDHIALYGSLTEQSNSTSFGTIQVDMQHSGDGIRWLNKVQSMVFQTSGNSTAELIFTGADTSGTVGLELVRFAITLAGVTLSAKLNLRAVLRDSAKKGRS